MIPKFDQNDSWELDSDGSTSTGVPTSCSSSARSTSRLTASSRPTSRGSSFLQTPRGASHRRRPLVDIDSPTSAGSWRSSSTMRSETPKSPWTRAPSRTKKSCARNDLSHLIAPVQPWNEFIEAYVKNLVEKVGGNQQAWTNVMSLKGKEVRTALTLSMMTPRGNKPRQLPEGISKALDELLQSLPPAIRNSTAQLTLALHERPFYGTALEKHVELVLWGVVSARNEWM